MDKSLLETPKKIISGLFNGLKLSSRYGKHKLLVLASYVLMSVLMVLWSFSTTKPLSNPIGARIEKKSMENGEQWIFLANESEENWENITMVLNEHYVYEMTTNIAEAEVEQVFIKDFDYLLYLPRARHHGTLEDVSEEVAGPKAPTTLEPVSIVIHTSQGSHSWDFMAQPPELKNNRGEEMKSSD